MEENVFKNNLEIEIKRTFSLLENKRYEEYKIGLLNLINKGYIEGYYYLGQLMDNRYRQYEDAYYMFSKGAEKGERLSLYQLGIYYLEGKVIVRDENKAYLCMNMSANLNLEVAQYQLGIMYKKGIGCESNIKHSKYWLERSANNGLKEAQFELGRMLIENKEEKEGIKWLRKGVENIDIPSNFLYGLCLFNGIGIDENKEMGLKFINAAAKDQYIPAIEFMISYNKEIK
jgi:TPR repeat protein